MPVTGPTELVNVKVARVTIWSVVPSVAPAGMVSLTRMQIDVPAFAVSDAGSTISLPSKVLLQFTSWYRTTAGQLPWVLLVTAKLAWPPLPGVNVWP